MVQNNKTIEKNTSNIPEDFMMSFSHHNKFYGFFEGYLAEESADHKIEVSMDMTEYVDYDKLFFSFFINLGKKFAIQFNDFVIDTLLKPSKKSKETNISIKNLLNEIENNSLEHLESILIVDKITENKIINLFNDEITYDGENTLIKNVPIISLNSPKLKNKIIMIVSELVFISFKEFTDNPVNEKIISKKERIVLQNHHERPSFYTKEKNNIFTIGAILKLNLCFDEEGYNIFTINKER